MEGISIATLNVDGLRTNEKRNKIFQYFENSQYDIVLLQETHVRADDIKNGKKSGTTTLSGTQGSQIKPVELGS